MDSINNISISITDDEALKEIKNSGRATISNEDQKKMFIYSQKYLLVMKKIRDNLLTPHLNNERPYAKYYKIHKHELDE